MLALDTAQPASALIAMYETWGYSVVGECDWRPLTNYTSVLMARNLLEAAEPIGRGAEGSTVRETQTAKAARDERKIDR